MVHRSILQRRFQRIEYNGFKGLTLHEIKFDSQVAQIIIVEPIDANAIALSLHHDETIILDQVGRFVDGVAVEEVIILKMALALPDDSGWHVGHEAIVSSLLLVSGLIPVITRQSQSHNQGPLSALDRPNYNPRLHKVWEHFSGHVGYMHGIAVSQLSLTIKMCDNGRHTSRRTMYEWYQAKEGLPPVILVWPCLYAHHMINTCLASSR
ncbi:hypothetical protein Tco_0758071 [Tanacetum coccineum]